MLISKVLTLWFSLNSSSSTTEVWLYSSALCLHFPSLLSSLFSPLSWVSYKEKALIVTTDRWRWACQPADLGRLSFFCCNTKPNNFTRLSKWTMNNAVVQQSQPLIVSAKTKTSAWVQSKVSKQTKHAHLKKLDETVTSRKFVPSA